MEENIRTQEEISLGDIFRILFKKIKVLILALVIGALVGAGFGVIRTFDVKYYGTSVSFYVNPKKDNNSITNDSQYGVYGAYGWHVMDNMTRLLASESFAEELMLDSDGLPLDGSEGDGYNLLPETDNREAINAKMAETSAPLAAAKAASEAADKARADTADKLKVYNEANVEYNRLLASNSNNVQKDDVDIAKGIAENAKANWQTAVEAEDNAEKAEFDAWEKANEAVEAVRVEWRKTALYQSYVQKITRSIAYSYVDEEDADADVSELAKSFIYVKISVLEDEGAFANFLFDRVNKVLPEYVETNMAVPSGYVGTNCQRITRLDKVQRTNEGYMTSTAIKYALILGAAALVVACVAVIIIDRSNKRLRDYELTFEKFGVPVLGVVPTIDEREYTAKTEQEQTTGVEK
jgi:capsular polysaccharide biosynthesis protein